MGAATAYHLARLGKKVALIEQFAIGHENGGSHGGSRIFRLSYPDSIHVRLLTPALEAWRRLEDDSSTELLVTTGGLDIGSLKNPVLRGCLAALRAEKIDHELIDEREMARRFSQFEVDEGMVGLFQKDAGIIRATEAVLQMVRMAESRGAQIFANTRFESIEYSDDNVSIITDKEKVSARLLVLAQGGWVEKSLGHLGVSLPIQVRKEQVVYFRAQDKDSFKVGDFPIFCEYEARKDDEDIGFYGFPQFECPGAVKLALHQAGPVTTADGRDFLLEEDGLSELVSHVEKRFPHRFGEIVDWKTCLYANTVDRDFVADFLPDHKNVFLLSACSGHGFKFSPLFGNLCARSILNGALEECLSPFSLSRSFA